MAGQREGKVMGLDQTVPRWLCQKCRHPFVVVGADVYAERAGEASRAGAQASVHGGGSVFAGSRMDQSFVVLPKQGRGAGGFPPPRPRGSGIPHPGAGAGMQPVQHPAAGGDREGPAGRAMEGSFVVLPSAAASMYRVEAPSDAGQHAGAGGGMQHTNNASFNASVNVLNRVFDIATAESQVEHPLCVECMRLLSEELDQQVAEAQREIKAYEEALVRLKREPYQALSEEEFARDKQQIEDEEQRLEAEIRAVESETDGVRVRLHEIEKKAKEFEDLERSYWHDVNEYRFQLEAHQNNRDSVLAKIEVAQAQLEMLKRTNVLNDAFFIWHDGDFGTINNFRLGRLPNIPVEWDEINAAWGQACLLLSTMAQFCHVTLKYRIMPLGSYPRISDSQQTYELFGPVNLFWSTRYDKAMTLFIACLKEFAEFARAADKKRNMPEDKLFKLPYKIEDDKVEGLTITQSFNRQEKWTKALKFTLCDLKWALFWVIGHMGGTGTNPSPSASVISSSNITLRSRGPSQPG